MSLFKTRKRKLDYYVLLSFSLIRVLAKVSRQIGRPAIFTLRLASNI